MDQLHATLHKASRSVSMDPHLRAGFRRTLEAVTATSAPVPAFRMPKALAWSFAVMALAIGGAGVTYASTQAVPGDALYAMKVRVVEPTETALAFSAEAKADVAVAHVERRFREAATLSAEGRLEAHDERLAARVATDIAVAEASPSGRERVEALAVAYGPTLRLHGFVRGKFAAAVRLGDMRDNVPDGLAAATARQQLAIASERSSEAASIAPGNAAVSLRLQEADRLSAAASAELESGSLDDALELSGVAAKVATEAQLFATLATSSEEVASSTATTSTSTASTTAQATTTVEAEDSFLMRFFR
jgi:hypothetical protein